MTQKPQRVETHRDVDSYGRSWVLICSVWLPCVNQDTLWPLSCDFNTALPNQTGCFYVTVWAFGFWISCFIFWSWCWCYCDCVHLCLFCHLPLEYLGLRVLFVFVSSSLYRAQRLYLHPWPVCLFLCGFLNWFPPWSYCFSVVCGLSGFACATADYLSFVLDCFVG